MANSKQALKRARQNLIRRARNSHFKTLMRSQVRAVREAVESGDANKAQELLVAATSAIHRVAGKGVIHTRAADRSISRLARQVKAMSGAAES